MKELFCEQLPHQLLCEAAPIADVATLAVATAEEATAAVPLLEEPEASIDGGEPAPPLLVATGVSAASRAPEAEEAEEPEAATVAVEKLVALPVAEEAPGAPGLAVLLAVRLAVGNALLRGGAVALLLAVPKAVALAPSAPASALDTVPVALPVADGRPTDEVGEPLTEAAPPEGKGAELAVLLIAPAPRQPPAPHAPPAPHTATPTNRVQCAPAATAGQPPPPHAPLPHAPPAPSAATLPSAPPALMVKAASPAHTAAPKPWQARPWALHDRPSLHSVAARGALVEPPPVPPPARAPSQAAQAGAAAMPSASARPR